MRWLRAIWRLLLELAKGPEGPTLGEVADYGRRRLILRAMIGVVVAPLVIGGMFAWDAASDAWSTANSPCRALFPEADLAAWAPGPLLPPRAGGDAAACWASWSTDAGPFLDVHLRVRGLPGPRGERVLERWDWERPERVVVVGDPRRPTARVDLPDGRQLVIENASPDTAPLARLVSLALENLPPKP